MSTKDDAAFEADLKEMMPHEERLVNSQQARAARRSAASAKQRITIRVDEDILVEFKELAGDDGNYQTLINHALRQWLEARGLKEMLREELPSLLERALHPVLSSP